MFFQPLENSHDAIASAEKIERIAVQKKSSWKKVREKESARNGYKGPGLGAELIQRLWKRNTKAYVQNER